MIQKFQNLGSVLSRDAQKKLVGGGWDESIEGEGGFGSCNVDCTGCPQYRCTSGCDAMENGVSVTCQGVKKTCNAYPTCWS
jgi:hypothetical protein